MAGWGRLFCKIDGLVQEWRNLIANALDLRISCTNPSKWGSPIVEEVFQWDISCLQQSVWNTWRDMLASFDSKN